MSPSEPPSPASSREPLILHLDMSSAGAVITAQGDLDVYTTLKLTGLVEDLVRRPGNDGLHLVLDLSGITFMSAAGITALLMARHAVQFVSGRLVLRNSSIAVRVILALNGLPTFFDMEHTGGHGRPGDGRSTTGPPPHGHGPDSISNTSHALPPRSPSDRRSPTGGRGQRPPGNGQGAY
jgi:anti-anti-sigma factor